MPLWESRQNDRVLTPCYGRPRNRTSIRAKYNARHRQGHTRSGRSGAEGLSVRDDRVDILLCPPTDVFPQYETLWSRADE